MRSCEATGTLPVAGWATSGPYLPPLHKAGHGILISKALQRGSEIKDQEPPRSPSWLSWALMEGQAAELGCPTLEPRGHSVAGYPGREGGEERRSERQVGGGGR